MVFLGALRGVFLSNAKRGFMTASAINPRIGNFNELRDLDKSDRKAVVELSNLKHLEKTLRTLGPKMLRDFKRDARRVGQPAMKDVRKAFTSIGPLGPRGGPSRDNRYYDKMSNSFVGRLSWRNSYVIANRRGIEVNYKNRNENKALSRLQAAQDGTISIVRIVVRAPAFIVADMAGKSNRAQKGDGELSRMYRIHEFGGPYIQRQHRVRTANTDNWIRKLNEVGKGAAGRPSRYVYPAVEGHMNDFRTNSSKLFNRTIGEINRILEA